MVLTHMIFDNSLGICQTNVDSERTSKWRMAAQIVENLERKIEEIYTAKADKFEAINDKVCDKIGIFQLAFLNGEPLQIKVLFDHVQQ